MRLSDYVREDLIIHRLKVQDASGALEAFGSLFEERGHVPSGQKAVQALKTREEAHTTCLGRGIAVPHATMEGLPKALLLVATADSPVAFGPPGVDPVDLFFVLLSPLGREGEHIKLLARICRIAQHEEDLAEVRAAKDEGSLHQAILRLDARHV
jgi:PTS system nitrogen regulatory IIA component